MTNVLHMLRQLNTCLPHSAAVWGGWKSVVLLAGVHPWKWALRIESLEPFPICFVLGGEDVSSELLGWPATLSCHLLPHLA